MRSVGHVYIETVKVSKHSPDFIKDEQDLLAL